MLKRRKNTGSENSKALMKKKKQKNNAVMKCVTIKNQNLSKSKELVDY